MYKFFMLDRGNLAPQKMDNVELKLCQAVKDTQNNPLFTEGWQETPALPWEIRYDNAYPNVIYDPQAKKYRCYYTLFTWDSDSRDISRAQRASRQYQPNGGRITSLALAESDDGIHWIKPRLGLVNFEGSTENNLVFRYAHGTGIMLDATECDPSRRYKLVTKVEYPGGRNYMAVNFSADGIHWGEMIPWPKHNPAADSHNFVFRDAKDGKYKLITRTWSNGVRLSAVCESTDFYNWSEPQEILRCEGFESQVYSMPIFQQDGLYLGLASMFHEGDRSHPDFDNVDLELKYATKLAHMDSVAKGQYLIARGQGRYPDGEFDCGCIYAAVPVEMDGKLCIYYMGGNGQHTNYRETSFARAFLEKDKYAYYCQRDTAKAGLLVTAQFHLFEEKLRILADLEQDGSLEIALCNRATTQVYPGFDFADCRLTKQADGWYDIAFAKPLMSLDTTPVTMVIRFCGAKIYALSGDLELQTIRE